MVCTYMGRRVNLYEVVAPHRDTVADEWEKSVGYVRGSNISVRGYLDLCAWSLGLRA